MSEQDDEQPANFFVEATAERVQKAGDLAAKFYAILSQEPDPSVCQMAIGSAQVVLIANQTDGTLETAEKMMEELIPHLKSALVEACADVRKFREANGMSTGRMN